MIDHSRKIIFIHITRTGGTSIESALCGKDWWLIDPNTKHLSASMTRAICGEKIWNSYFKFTIVRNPWDRIVSMYATGWWLNKVNGEDSNIYPSMKEFILMLVPHETEKHGFKFYHEIIDEELDFIARYESIQTDFQAICAKAGLVQTELPHEEIRFREHYSAYFDDETVDLVKDIYKIDIEKYGYNFERKLTFDSTALLRLQNIHQQMMLNKNAISWAERSEALLVTERENNKKLLEWAERSEALLVTERENNKKLLEWAERSEALLVTERENSNKLVSELDEFRGFVKAFNWIYQVYKKCFGKTINKV